MFKRLLFSQWSNDEIVITLKIYAARWYHLPQAVLNQVPDVHDGDEPRVPDTEECSVFQTFRSVLPRVKCDVLYPEASRTYKAAAVVKLLWSCCCPQLPAVDVVPATCSPERSQARDQWRAQVLTCFPSWFLRVCSKMLGFKFYTVQCPQMSA